MLLISLMCHTPIVIRATRALFQQFDDEIYPWNRGKHVQLMPIGASACPMVVFSGIYESHWPPPLGNARGIIPAHRHGHQNGQQSGHILHLHFVCCHLGGRRGDTEQVVARWRHLVAFMKALDLLHWSLGDERGIAPSHRHGYQNGLQRMCFC